MFKDFEAQYQGQSAKFADTAELVSGIAAWAQGVIDPSVSPEVRERWQNQLEFAGQVLERSQRSVYLWEVELPTEEVRIYAGKDCGPGIVVVDDDGRLSALALTDYDYGSQSVANFWDTLGRKQVPVLRVRRYVRLGR